MNKKYILGFITAAIPVAIFLCFFAILNEKSIGQEVFSVSRIGQKLWVYNINEKNWSIYKKNAKNNPKETITLQMQEPVGNGGYTSYRLLVENEQILKDDILIGEGSQEFLVNDKLYSYYPKTFEFYEIIFDKTQFTPRKLELTEIKELFKGYNIIKISDFKNNQKISLNYNKKDNKFIVVNDGNINFYKYRIIPNSDKKIKFERFLNQFRVFGKVFIRIQRFEECSNNYPCYDIEIK